jgi:hypothetical protein
VIWDDGCFANPPDIPRKPVKKPGMQLRNLWPPTDSAFQRPNENPTSVLRVTFARQLMAALALAYLRESAPLHKEANCHDDNREHSDSSCRQGRSWGFDRRGIWVDHGCRADFQVGR